MAKAIIVAAGMGRRLEGFIGDTPKSLICLGEKTIIGRQIETLRSCGIEEIAVVVGYKRKKIMEHLGDTVSYYFNPFFETTNSVVSLWLARDVFDGKEDVLVLNGDVVAESSIIHDLLNDCRDMCVAVKLGRYNESGYKARIENDRVVDMGMDIERSQVAGEYAGLSSVSRDRSVSLVQALDQFMENKEFGTWYETVYVDMIERANLSFVDVGDRRWAEIDTREDMEEAMKRWSWDK